MFDPTIDVQRLRLAPGDVVILTLPESVSEQAAGVVYKRLVDCLRAAGHGDVPVAIAYGETTVSVLGANEPGAMTTSGGGAPR